MPVADLLVDAAAGHQIISFMDGNAGYNQIFMAEEDIPKTAFRCPCHVGLFEWIVMTFGLKNAGCTYQRAMNFIFHEFIGKLVEIYIDDVGQVWRFYKASCRFAKGVGMHKEAWFEDESQQVCIWCVGGAISWLHGASKGD